MSPPPRNGGIASSSSRRPQSDADPGRAQHLVAAEGQEVAVQRAHVHRQMRHALRAVQQHQRAGRVRLRDHRSTGGSVPSTFDICVTATSFGRFAVSSSRA